MNERKIPQYALIAGVLYAILTLHRFSNMVSLWKYIGFNSWAFLWMATDIFIAVVLIMKKRDILPVVAFGIPVLFNIISFFRGFFQNSYSVVSWRRGTTFNIFCTFPALADLVAVMAIFALAGIMLTDYFPAYKEKVKKLWMIPSVCTLGAFVIAVILYVGIKLFGNAWYAGQGYVSFQGLIFRIIRVAALLFAGAWFAYPEGLPKMNQLVKPAAKPVQPQPMNMSGTVQAPSANAANNSQTFTQTTYNAGNGAAYELSQEAHCDLVKHILLLFVTCGVWYLIWIYKTSSHLNCVQDEEPWNPTVQLLLCMFVPFYSIYWTYKAVQRIDKLAKMKGVTSDLAVICLILAIFVPIVPPMLMQDKMNAIIKANGNVNVQYAPPSAPVQQPEVQTQTVNVVEELKQCKELLDMGIITQEDFDAKKKQLLGL